MDSTTCGQMRIITIEGNELYLFEPDGFHGAYANENLFPGHNIDSLTEEFERTASAADLEIDKTDLFYFDPVELGHEYGNLVVAAEKAGRGNSQRELAIEKMFKAAQNDTLPQYVEIAFEAHDEEQAVTA